MKYFTLKQAEKTIPSLETIFKTANEIRERAQSKSLMIRARERDGSLNTPDGAIEQAQVEFLAGCFQEALQGVEKLGAVLKGMDPGLVDFPCRWNGDEIYLCWRQGEKRIEHYHSMDEGFAGRKPLPKNIS